MLLDSHEHRSVIDFMRATGIILVICFHVVVGLASLFDAAAMPDYIAAIPPVFNILWQAQGSELVFLFSGFLLSYLVLREQRLEGRVDLRNFYVRRVARIVPLYFVGLAFYALIRNFTWTDLLLNLLFVSKLFDARTIIPVGWSLEVLVQSFILLPLIALAFVRSKAPVMLTLVAIAASIAARYHALIIDPDSYAIPIHMLLSGFETPETIDDLYYHLGYRATPFLLGFLMAYLAVYREALLRHLFAGRLASLAWLAVSFVLIVGSAFLPVQDPGSWLYELPNGTFTLWYWTIQRFVFASGVCLFTLTLWYGGSRVLRPVVRVAQWPTWKTVSDNIYSIYLFHPLFLIPAAVIAFRTWHVEEVPPVHLLEVVVTMTIAAVMSTWLGKLLTRYVEAPSRAWIRKRFSR